MVARRRCCCTTPTPTPTCCVSCTAIPLSLSVTETFLTGTFLGSGAVSLNYTSGTIWAGSSVANYPGAVIIGCPAATVPLTWTFDSSDCSLHVSWPIYVPSGSNCPTTALLGTSTASTAYGPISTEICSPFDITYTLFAGDQNTDYQTLSFSSGSTATADLSGVGVAAACPAGGSNCSGITTGCPVIFCTFECDGATPIGGCTVTVKSGATVIATNTVEAGGCIALDVGTAGTYTILVTVGSSSLLSTSGPLVCCGTSNLTTTCCCANLPTIFPTLFLTDANGTHTCTYSSGAWKCCVTVTVTAMQTSTSGGCHCTTTASIAIPVQYAITCSGETLTVTRSWGEDLCTGGCFYSGHPTFACTATTPCTVSGATGTSIGTGAWTNCGPMAWYSSGLTLTADYCSGYVPDPIGGAVTITS